MGLEGQVWRVASGVEGGRNLLISGGGWAQMVPWECRWHDSGMANLDEAISNVNRLTKLLVSGCEVLDCT